VEATRNSYAMTGNVPDLEQDPEAADREEPEKQKKHSQLVSWLEHERDRQADNRAEMAIDGDYYDGLQWTEREALEVESRGQAPLVFNETKVAIDWIIGAEKRNRVDWRVLPREESDVEGATVRSKVLKYLSDVNRVPFMRSSAFAEAAISGLSWLEDSLSMDATEDPLYSGFESWRNVLHDSYHKRPDGKDMRYCFRWRHVDLDIGQALWPAHADALERLALGADQLTADAEDELWYLGQNIRDPQTQRTSAIRHLSSTGSSVLSDRRRVKVYEAWYRQPMTANVLQGGPYQGEIYTPGFEAHERAVRSGACDIFQAIVLRTRLALMTDADLLEDCETPFAHNLFPLTPLYCFRRQRDGMPYGHVRPMRDPQSDLNKRMSKSLFLLSVNQLVVEKNTFSDNKDEYTLEDAMANASNPNGVFVLQHGDAKFELRRDFAEIRGHAEILALDRQFLQSSSGVNNEQLGRDTNVVSGKGILAKQEQGSLTTTGIFDNHRLAISVSGQKALSNVERFYTQPKVIRLTESQPGDTQPKLDWVKINQPELQADGTVRFLNDITQSHADFIVDEQDYRASMREALFESLIDLVKVIAPVAPLVAVGMLDIVVAAKDFPGKEEAVQRVKELIAEARGQLKSPEQKAKEAELEALKKRELAAKIAKDEAAADKTDAESDVMRLGLVMGTGEGNPDFGGNNAGADGPAGSMAPPAGQSPAVSPAAAGNAQPAGAATQPAPAATGGPDIAAALEQGQAQIAQMLQHQSAIHSQQAAQATQATNQALAQIAAGMQQLAQMFAAMQQQSQAAAAQPRKKTIRILDAEGREIHAEVES
jgi:hypothetical protein